MAKPSKPSAFVRDATGLVREFGAWDSFAFQFGGITTAVGISVMFVALNFLLGANIMISLLILLPVLVAYFVVDTQLGISMPRSGSDYIYTSRILHPALGMMAGWMLTFLLILNPAFLSDLAVTGYIPGLLTALGMGSQAAMFSDTTVRLVLDNVIIAFCTLLIVIPIRKYSKFQTLFIVLELAAAILIPIAFLAIGHDGFVSAINARSPVGYTGIISKAESLGYTPHFSWTDTILAIPSLSLFLITNWPCAVAGEIKNVKKSLTFGMMGAGLGSWLIFFITAGLYYAVLGPDFAGSIAYLAINSPSDSPFGSSNLLTTILQYVYGSNWVTFVITIGLIAAVIIVVAQSMLLSTRFIFAWSFDSVIPSKFATVSERFGTPLFSALAVWIISEVVLFIVIYASSALGILLNAAIGVLIGYSPALFAGMLFSRRRKEMFNQAPDITRRKIGGVNVITILGGFAGLGFLTFLAFTAAFPQIGYPITPYNVGFELLIFALGGVVYYIGKWYRAKQGVDIAMAFQQIPPE